MGYQPSLALRALVAAGCLSAMLLAGLAVWDRIEIEPDRDGLVERP